MKKYILIVASLCIYLVFTACISYLNISVENKILSEFMSILYVALLPLLLGISTFNYSIKIALLGVLVLFIGQVLMFAILNKFDFFYNGWDSIAEFLFTSDTGTAWMVYSFPIALVIYALTVITGKIIKKLTKKA
jgi:hypothetical protein